MVEDNKKVALGLGLGLAAAGGLVYALTRKPPVEKPSAAEIVIKVYDSQGRLVPHNSPLDLEEGESYTIVLTVTNQTTKAGTPWEASLGVGIHVFVDSIDLIPPDFRYGEYFAPGQTREFSWPLDIPLDIGARSGSINASVLDPDGRRIASDIKPLNIIAVEIIYGATVVIG